MKNNSIQKYDESEELYYAELAKMGFKVVREKRPKPEISSVAVDNHLKPFSNIIPLGEKRKAGCNILQTDTIKSVFKSSKISKKEDSLPKFHPLSSAMGERNHSNKKDGITISTIANKNYAKADSDNANFGEEEEVANLAGEVRNEDDDNDDDEEDDDDDDGDDDDDEDGGVDDDDDGDDDNDDDDVDGDGDDEGIGGKEAVGDSYALPCYGDDAHDERQEDQIVGGKNQ